MIRRHPVQLAALALALQCAWVSAQTTSDFPSRPMRFIAPFAAGGATDIVTRLVAAELARDLGKPVVVENRAGAGGNIGMEALAKAAPDGYTFGVGAGATLAVNPNLYASLPFDTARDFVPVHPLVLVPHALIINRDIPAQNLKDLVARMKANPGKFSFGSPGTGTTGHLYGELFKRAMGVEMTHIPFKGGNQVRQEIIAGRLELSVSTLVDALTQIQTGSVRGLAVVAGRRVSAVPDIPTFAELGVPGFDSENFFGLITPAGVPREIILLLNARVATMVSRAEFRARLTPIGLEAPKTQTPEEFAQFILAHRQKWGRIVRELNLRAD